MNFHEGQRQAILNTIYLHEVLQINGVKEMYMAINSEFLQEMDLTELETDKYKHPKYAIKMATGTGKTWVLNALLIWQYLTPNTKMNLLADSPKFPNCSSRVDRL